MFKRCLVKHGLNLISLYKLPSVRFSIANLGQLHNELKFI